VKTLKKKPTTSKPRAKKPREKPTQAEVVAILNVIKEAVEETRDFVAALHSQIAAK
jgi:signal transduction histidine kinase